MWHSMVLLRGRPRLIAVAASSCPGGEKQFTEATQDWTPSESRSYPNTKAVVTSFSFLNSTPDPRISSTLQCSVTHVLKTALSTLNRGMACSQVAAGSRVARGSVLGEASLRKASGVREHGNHMAAARTDWPAVSHLRTPGAGSNHMGDCQTASYTTARGHNTFLCPFSALPSWTLLTAAPAPVPSWPHLCFQTCSLTRHCTSSTLCLHFPWAMKPIYTFLF